jgi:hypothetical protein
LVSCFSPSYESRSSSMNASWSVPASAMVNLLQSCGLEMRACEIRADVCLERWM